MKNLLIILTLTTLLACSESKEVEEQFYNLDVNIEFSIFNSENEDLLNPTNTNHIDTSKIKLFYVINGKKEEVYNPNLEHPRNFKVYKHSNEYRVRIFLNHTETSDKPITYVQWNENDIDTLEATYQRHKNAIIKSNIWLNRELIWELKGEVTDPYFVLTK